jgi:hypothetical protein
MRRLAFGWCGLTFTPRIVLAQVATGQGIEVPILRIVLSFGACAILAVLAALALRSRGKMKWFPIQVTPRRLRILETSRLSLKSSLVLVELDGRTLLFSSDPGGTHLVMEVPPSKTEAMP